MSTAWVRAREEMESTFLMVNEEGARLIDELANRGGDYLARHKAKMGWAEDQKWENIGLSFDKARPASEYPEADLRGTTLKSRIEYWELRKRTMEHPDFKWGPEEIAKAERIPIHKTVKVGDFEVTREAFGPPGQMTLDFKFTKNGKTYYLEGMDPTFKNVSKVEMGKLELAGKGKYGAGMGPSGVMRVGGVVQFFVDERISSSFSVGANNIDGGFRRTSQRWKEAFYRHAEALWETIRSPSPTTFKRGKRSSLIIRKHIDAYVTYPGLPKTTHGGGRGVYKRYAYRVWTMHPEATSWEYGLMGTSSGIPKETYPRLRGLGTPSWRYKEFS
jgi:hypothetical protein